MAANEDYVRDEILNTDEMRKVFIQRIPSGTQDADLQTFLEGICEGSTIEQIQIIPKKEGASEKKPQFGFATFTTCEQVDDLLLNRTSVNFNGTALDVNRAVPKTNTWHGAHEKTTKLFIANLPRSAKQEELQEYFEARHPSKYGTITDIQLIKKKNEDGSRQEDCNLGYGFVFVSSEDMADKMAIQHNHFTFGGRQIELKKSVASIDGGNRGRGRGRGGDKGMMRGGGGRGGGQFQQSYGGGYDAGFGGQWPTDQYAAGYGYDGSYGGGYGAAGGYGAGGYGGGYGAPRGRGARFTPY